MANKSRNRPVGDDHIPPLTSQEEEANAPSRKRQKTGTSSTGIAPTTAEPPNTTSPPSRQASAYPPVQLSRKGKACISCRKLKVKCDSAERGMGDCSRCLRLGLKCVSKRQIWANSSSELSESQEQQQQQNRITIVKLERALEDVLEKLNMPALEMYAPQAILEQNGEESPRSTRKNSPEPSSSAAPNGPVGAENTRNSSTGENGKSNGDRDLSPGPMRSLMEATRLAGLSSQLRSVKQRRKGGMRRMDSDLISEKVITYEQAQEIFHVFMTTLSPYLFSGSIPPDATFETVRTSSTVLFTAIMLVGAHHIPGYESIHEACHCQFLGLVSSAIFDRFHTLDDIRGLCIAALWEPDLSWKLSGISIRMATELSLHQAFYEAFYTPDADEQAKKDSLEKARLWYLLFVLDHQSSIAYGRPPSMAELRPIKDYQVLLKSDFCTSQDRALMTQVTGSVALSKAFEIFGLERKRTMGGDDNSVLTHLRFSEECRLWRENWKRTLDDAQASPQEAQENPQRIISGHEVIDLHYYFSELVLNSLVLRGRSLSDIEILPMSLRPLCLKAIEAAHHILVLFVGEGSTLGQGLVGMPLYLHSMIAFAVVFLMRMQSKWHLIGITIDVPKKTRPLIQNTIRLLRGCKAGSDHIIFSMANGFSRMLKQADYQRKTQRKAKNQASSSAASTPAASTEKNQKSSKKSSKQVQNDSQTWSQPQTQAQQQQLQQQQQQHVTFMQDGGSSETSSVVGAQAPQLSQQQHMQHPLQAMPLDPRYHPALYDNGQSPDTDAAYGMQSGISPFENWNFQDQELWNLGMGYDLLAPTDGMFNAQGYPAMFEQ